MVDEDAERPDGQQRRVTRIEIDAVERPTLVNEMWARGRDTTYRYDANGNVARRQTDGRFLPTAENPDRYDGGRTTAFVYDPLDRETRAIVCPDPTGACTESTAGARITRTDWYDSGDKSLIIKPNDVRESRFWFNDGRLAQMTRTTAGGVEQKSQLYAYDPNGNRTLDERGSHRYSARDGLIRWTRATRPANSTVHYELTGSGAIDREQDSAGPDTDYEYVGDRLDKATITGDGGSVSADYRYDDFGSLSRIDADGADTRFVYDEFQRLVQAKSDDPQAGEADDRFCYDGLDRRDLRIVGSDTATCSNPTAGGAQTLEYSYVGLTEQLSREQRSDGTARTYDYDSAHQRLGQTRPGGAYRSYAIDANGSVEGLESANGTVAPQDSYSYDPYGNLQPRTKDPDDPTADAEAELSPEAQDNPFRFEGFYYDRGPQAYDMQAREYLPDIGRFLSPDRYEDPTRDLALQLDPRTHNRYAFVGGNPVTYLDFDGHEPPHGSYVDAPTDYYGESSMSPKDRREQQAEERRAPTFLSPDARDRNLAAPELVVARTWSNATARAAAWRAAHLPPQEGFASTEAAAAFVERFERAHGLNWHGPRSMGAVQAAKQGREDFKKWLALNGPNPIADDVALGVASSHPAAIGIRTALPSRVLEAAKAGDDVARLSGPLRNALRAKAGFKSTGEPIIVDPSIGANPQRVAAALRARGINARSVREAFGRDDVKDPEILRVAEQLGGRVLASDRGRKVGGFGPRAIRITQRIRSPEDVVRLFNTGR
jgi:RHS repeat-associated protein